MVSLSEDPACGYGKYIRHDKVKIQLFLSGLPQSCKDIIEFYDPQTLNGTIRKEKYCYHQRKSRNISIRHGRKRRMRSLTKERRISSLLIS